jgi:hypothetical protein
LANFELGKGKRAFFRVWTVILVVLWVVAVAIVIFKLRG